MSKTYVVTGGCGFIGSHICEQLLAIGHSVRVIDDLSTGRRENISDSVDLHVADIRDREILARVMKGADGIFHLAAVASAPASIKDWLGTSSINLGGTINVLNMARSAGGSDNPVPVIYASSAAVYGDTETLPIAEDCPLKPLSGYAADKAACELHAAVAAHTFEVPTVGLRLFNVFGPRQDPSSPYSGVISLLLDSARKSTEFLIYGDGQQTRDFIWVGDVANAFLSAMQAASDSAESASIFNICSGSETTILDLISIVKKMTGAEFTTSNAPERAGDIRRSLGDPEHARRRLGFSHTTSMTEGLEKTWLSDSL